MNETTIHTRIQLKNDTEANWQRATGFIPRKGEVIVYSADDTHPFSRLKVGNGETTVGNLPFIDSGSANGVVVKENFSSFPAIGSQNVLYIEASSWAVYDWTPAEGYTVKYQFETQTINNVASWNAGTMTALSLDTNSPTLVVQNGTVPSLQLQSTDVVTGFEGV